MIGKPNQITVGIGVFDNPNKVGEKEPVYGEMSTPRNVRAVVDYMLNFFGAKESPVRATEVILKYDPELTHEYRVRERNRSDMTNDPVERHYYGLMRSDYYGWRLRVDHATDPEVLDKLGITQDQLYEGKEREREKAAELASAAIADVFMKMWTSSPTGSAHLSLEGNQFEDLIQHAGRQRSIKGDVRVDAQDFFRFLHDRLDYYKPGQTSQ